MLKEWLVINPYTWVMLSDFNTQKEAEQYTVDRGYIIANIRKYFDSSGKAHYFNQVR